MAETFKNFKLALTTSAAAAYTVPASTTAIVLMCQTANVTGEDAYATVSWTDSSDGDAETRLIKDAIVPAGAPLSILAGKFAMSAGDTIKAAASADSSIELSGSVLEISNA